MIKDRSALKAFLNKAATAQNETTRLSTLQALLASPQTVLDHFPMKALRLIRSWLVDALASTSSSSSTSTTSTRSPSTKADAQALTLASLQLLDRIPMTSEGVLESKIGQVILKVTKTTTTTLSPTIVSLAKRLSEKLVTIVSIHHFSFFLFSF